VHLGKVNEFFKMPCPEHRQHDSASFPLHENVTTDKDIRESDSNNAYSYVLQERYISPLQ